MIKRKNAINKIPLKLGLLVKLLLDKLPASSS